VTDRDLFQSWLFTYGPGKILLGADIKEGNIAVSGWTDVTEISLYDFLIFYEAWGVSQVLCTDIDKDGMMKGSSVDLYRQMVQDFPALQIIASGGISSINEIQMLNEYGVSGAVIGKALYEGKIRLEELREFLG
jgi:phosphoribosylformimino-5-aminoimidazole carboxamide ribotide isomerase